MYGIPWSPVLKLLITVAFNANNTIQFSISSKENELHPNKKNVPSKSSYKYCLIATAELRQMLQNYTTISNELNTVIIMLIFV